MKRFFALIFACFLLSGTAFAAGQGYILRDVDGIVEVFEKSDLVEPAFKTNIAVKLLPVFDQNQLKEGIYIEGNDALLCILEDLGS